VAVEKGNLRSNFSQPQGLLANEHSITYERTSAAETPRKELFNSHLAIALVENCYRGRIPERGSFFRTAVLIESAFLPDQVARDTECRRLKSLTQFVDKFAQGCLISAVPHPLSQLLCLHQARFCQDRHMMGDRRLRKVNPRLEIRSA